MRNQFSLLLLAFMAANFFMISPSLAIFKNSSSSGALIDIAEWDVTLNQGVNNNVEVQSGGQNGTYTFTVESDSEVNTSYSIIVRNVPNDVEVKLGTGNFKAPTNNVVTFPDAGTILYTDSPKVKEHTLTFKANSGAALVNNQTVTIDVDFKQMN